MKEEIYTIPVNEALEKDGECVFCTLNQKLESDILDYVLGPSYMEEDVRGETDKIGFCSEHYRQMYAAQNRLGVALMIDTHLKRIREELKKLAETDSGTGKKGLLGKKGMGKTNALSYIETVTSSCYACNRMKARMSSYIDTFFYLWKREDEFKAKVLASKGFCLEHFGMLLNEANNRFSVDKYKEFASEMYKLENKNLDKLQEDIDWFINKFDYRFKDEPWKNSKDALPRAILKLSGLVTEEQRNENS